MNDDLKHKQAVDADEQILDETSALGHASDEPLDIDATLESLGLRSDADGPKELNSEEVIDEADENQD